MHIERDTAYRVQVQACQVGTPCLPPFGLPGVGKAGQRRAFSAGRYRSALFHDPPGWFYPQQAPGPIGFSGKAARLKEQILIFHRRNHPPIHKKSKVLRGQS